RLSVRELLTAVRASPVRIVLSFAAIAFAALAGFVWSPQMAFVSARDLAPAGEKRFVAVKPQPFIWQIKLMGTIGP
ncbi:hypothetical protein, partial [Aeromonas veronii]|uniref:hypothetical protein n=1 Tax=Aeromonas veronii TaxID=654 RepID=UPI00406CAF2A